MLASPTLNYEQCIYIGVHMDSFQPGYGSEGEYLEQCTNCGNVEYIR